MESRELEYGKRELNPEIRINTGFFKTEINL